MKASIKVSMAMVALGMVVVGMGTVLANESDVSARRAQMNNAAAQGESGIPVLEKGLIDESPLVRRAAVRGLVDIGVPAVAALRMALDNSDHVVRRAALMALAGSPPDAAALPYIEKMLADTDAYVREMAARLLVAIEPRDDAVIALMQQVAEDESPAVRKITAELLAAFKAPERDVVLVRDRPDMEDHLERIFLIETMPLPREDWLLSADLAPDGHAHNWFAPEFDDTGWDPAKIGAAWEMDHVGVAWYRGRFKAPARPEKFLAVELLFEGVDECAWVWVNGVYVGGQDIGLQGWNKPFRVDVSDELRWGEENIIAVRVLNTMGAGGIWKPVTLEILGFK